MQKDAPANPIQMWTVKQPGLCSVCGRLLIPNEDTCPRFTNRKSPHAVITICGQCVLLMIDTIIKWDVESNLPGR